MSIKTYLEHRQLMRLIAVLLTILMLYSCLSLCMIDAKAIALADDVVLALLVGALAAIGVTASAPTMLRLGTGLADLVDEWEVEQGIVSGTLFGIIAESAIALGVGSFRLGNSAWEKIQDFVDWLKADKNMSYDVPVGVTGGSYLNWGDVLLPYNECKLSELSNSAIPITMTGYQRKLEYGTYYMYVWYSQNLVFESYPYRIMGSAAKVSPIIGGSLTILDSTQNQIAYITFDSNDVQQVKYQEIQGYIMPLVYICYDGSKWWIAMLNANGIGYYNRTNRYSQLRLDDIEIEDIEGYQITQTYPNDEEPLPYVPDIPLNVRIPGSTAGTLEQVANDISIAVESDTLVAEAVQTYPEGGEPDLPNIIIPSSGFFSSIWHYVVQAIQDSAAGIAFIFTLIHTVIPPAILNLAWAACVLLITFGILNKFLK